MQRWLLSWLTACSCSSARMPGRKVAWNRKEMSSCCCSDVSYVLYLSTQQDAEAACMSRFACAETGVLLRSGRACPATAARSNRCRGKDDVTLLICCCIVSRPSPVSAGDAQHTCNQLWPGHCRACQSRSHCLQSSAESAAACSAAPTP